VDANLLPFRKFWGVVDRTQKNGPYVFADEEMVAEFACCTMLMMRGDANILPSKWTMDSDGKEHRIATEFGGLWG